MLLFGVVNPHNFVALARTAAFFGLPRLVLSDHPAQASPSDASYRVAEGGLEYIELYRASKFAEAVNRLRQSHFVIGTTPARGVPLEKLRPTDRPIALILGNEEHGLPAATVDACDTTIFVPGSGRMQSLNVAATAAILIYALMRNRSGASRSTIGPHRSRLFAQ